MTTVTVTTPGSGSFTIPAGVTSITVEAWGGGAAGAGASSRAGDGGAGGSYIRTTYAVTGGDVIYYSVAAQQPTASSPGNQTWFNKNSNSNSTSSYRANGGGTGGGGSSGSTAQAGTGGTNTVSFTGGAPGPAASNSVGGGGGGGAGSAGNGGTTPTGAGGAGGTPDGGAGGTGGTSSSNGGNGTAPGGGGGGAAGTGVAGTGAAGQIQYSYVIPVNDLTVSSMATGSPAFSAATLGQKHGLTANAVATVSPETGLLLPDPSLEAGLPATVGYADGGGGGMTLRTDGGHSGSKYARWDVAGGHALELTGAQFVASSGVMAVSVWLRDSGIAGGWGATGYPDQPHLLQLWATPSSGTSWPTTIAGSGVLSFQAAAGSGWTQFSGVVTGLVPGVTYHVVAQAVYYNGSRQLDMDDLRISQVGVRQVHALGVAAMATAPPAPGTPALQQKQVLTVTSMAPAAPVLVAPAIKQIHAIGAAALTTGPPALGSPTVAVVANLTAVALATAAPVLQQPTLHQVHALASVALATGAPALAAPALGQVQRLTTAAIATGAPALGTPAVGQAHALATTGTTTASPAIQQPSLGVLATVFTSISAASVDAAGGWTDNTGGSAMAQAVDEAAADDSDYAQSSVTPVNDVLRLKLAAWPALSLHRTTTLRYRLALDGGDVTLRASVRLLEGTTVVGGPWVHTNLGAPATFVQDIDPTIIGNPNDLYLEVEAGA